MKMTLELTIEETAMSARLKKAYAKPALIVHGTMETMTRGGVFPGGRGSSRSCRNISGHMGIRTAQCGS
jgi:hypothetical protein